jgi:hypothetical protein
MSELTPAKIDDSIRYRKILDYPFDEVVSMSAGSSSFYMLGPDHKVY